MEAKNQVHQLYMGDRTHPEWKEIHEYLNELMAEMRNLGYVPEIGSALHDMEDEEKERRLDHHSEKLAVAFDLMHPPDGAPIRVMKNLRVYAIATLHSNTYRRSLVGKSLLGMPPGFIILLAGNVHVEINGDGGW